MPKEKVMLSVCGLKCDECEHFGTICTGCRSVKGSTFWAREMMPDKTCPLYHCSIEVKSFSDCGGCAELPCSLFREMKDPSATEEQHLENIKIRIKALQQN